MTLAGGHVGTVRRARLADGRTVVVRSTGYDARLEAQGLEALGAAVATLHRRTGDGFGWHRDNVIGPLPQVNTVMSDWPGFYAEHRLRPYLDDLPPDLDRWLIDPAVNRADRELDLAMLDLFGPIPDAFLRGYEEVWPLDEGWDRRRPVLQLYHLLVHVRLFGDSYLGGVAAHLDGLGW